MAPLARSLLTSVLLLLWSGLVAALTSTLQQVTNYGTNPTNVGMFVYKPTTVKANPAVIVAIHYCTGTAQAYFTGSPYAQLADTYGFIVIYPSSPNSGTCWDVSSKATLTHNGGGDSLGIRNQVAYAISTYGADPSRIFVTGSSSGAMMTNVLAAVYPDVFAAATVYSGVAAGCFMSSFGGVDAWNSSCAEGQVSATSAQWAAVVRAMYPGYTGAYPPIQEYHGTIDTTLLPENLGEEVKEWAGIFGYNAAAPTQVLQNTPLSGYTKSIYGPALQGILATGVGHTVPIQGNEDMKWFGFVAGGAAPPKSTGSGTGTGTTSTSTVGPTSPPTTTVSTPTSTPTGGTAQHWGEPFLPRFEIHEVYTFGVPFTTVIPPVRRFLANAQSLITVIGTEPLTSVITVTLGDITTTKVLPFSVDVAAGVVGTTLLLTDEITLGGTLTTIVVHPTPVHLYNRHGSYHVHGLPPGTISTNVLAVTINPPTHTQPATSVTISPPTHSAEATQPATGASSHVPLGAVVGAVSGCIILLSLGAAALFILGRRRRREAKNERPRKTESAFIDCLRSSSRRTAHALIVNGHQDTPGPPTEITSPRSAASPPTSPSSAPPSAPASASSRHAVSSRMPKAAELALANMADEMSALRSQVQRLEQERAAAPLQVDDLPPQYVPR
ncbi:Carbohydrate esterase family 1 and carbohydrate-binding module family 1 protein [Mycena venus]|uniref:Carbohydrate esterase family 1 and carbohydrate-binding module family 1 protein n=1 Tax=Mycena venus TaxID=2733690 RepID=A0A8H7CSM6_9AGAR|nr:Carbohydrate esterase family 1 and carbohydrate-binding module family 1 protein [Mycena venus]